MEKQITVFQDKEVVLSFGDWIMTDEKGQGIMIGNYSQFPKFSLNNQPVGSILNLFGKLNFYLMSPTIMIRKDILLKIGGFQKDKSYPFVDIPTYLALALTGKFFYHQDILGFYRKQQNSSWFKFALKTKTIARREINQCFWNFIKKKKKEIKRQGIVLEKKIKIKGRKYLLFKKRTRFLTFFYHYLAFGRIPMLNWLLRLNFLINYLIYLLKKRTVLLRTVLYKSNRFSNKN